MRGKLLVGTTMLVLQLASACARMGFDPTSELAPGPVVPPVRQAFWQGNVTLVNSFWKDVLTGQDELRTGHSLYLQTVNPALVRPGARYQVSVENLRSGEVIQASTSLADEEGRFEMASLLQDVGQDDGISAGDTLRITVGAHGAEDPPHVVDLKVAARDQDPLEPGMIPDPLVFASDSQGHPVNSFVVDSDRAPEEVGGPVYVSGSGFPEDVTQVHIYVMKDRDHWASNQSISRAAADGFVRGPILGKVANGMLEPTSTGFKPTDKLLGPYDILVDVDRDGRFQYEVGRKDAADGEAKVGFTVQRSTRWLDKLKDKHLLVNLSYDSFKRGGGSFRNLFQAGQEVYVYVNPPVSHSHHKGNVTKWVVAHRDFASFWDRPDAAGGVPFKSLAVDTLETTPQRGCTNSPPTYVLTARRGVRDPETDQTIDCFDIVLDYDNDGRYTPGIDILDVASVDETADLMAADAVRGLRASQGCGFRVE